MASTKKPTKETRKSSADDSTKLERLRELVCILEASDTLGELEYEDADIAVRLSRGTGAAPAPMMAHIPAPSMPPAPAPPGAAATEVPAPAEDDNLEVVKSPFVGTFYRSPSPKDPAFTDVGAKVKPKQVLCIIEAMKLMNEIECEVSGKVVEILSENGQPVQYGDPLFKIAVDK